MSQGIKFRQFVAKHFFVVYIIFAMIGLITAVLGASSIIALLVLQAIHLSTGLVVLGLPETIQTSFLT